MNLQECIMLEDMFPKSFTDYEERPYGILFYNTTNKDSYESNHAVIVRDQIDDLSKILEDVITFYTEKEIKPTIYQSTLDSGYFGEINKELALAGFSSTLTDKFC